MIINYGRDSVVLGDENNPDIISGLKALGWIFKRSYDSLETDLPESWRIADNHWRADTPDKEKYMRFENEKGDSVTARPFPAVEQSCVEISMTPMTAVA